MSHDTNLDKLGHMIWCEIYIVQEGYIPYLNKWSKIQRSKEVKLVDRDLQEEDIHNNIQRLFLSGPKKVDNSPVLANSDDTRQPSEKLN